MALALYGGEEYKLIFTVKPYCVDETKTELLSVGAELIELGVVTKENDIARSLDIIENWLREQEKYNN